MFRALSMSYVSESTCPTPIVSVPGVSDDHLGHYNVTVLVLDGVCPA